MAVKSMTCLECPRGCQLEIDLETLNVTGNFCQRGDAFATIVKNFYGEP